MGYSASKRRRGSISRSSLAQASAKMVLSWIVPGPALGKSGLFGVVDAIAFGDFERQHARHRRAVEGAGDTEAPAAAVFSG